MSLSLLLTRSIGHTTDSAVSADEQLFPSLFLILVRDWSADNPCSTGALRCTFEIEGFAVTQLPSLGDIPSRLAGIALG